MMLQLGPMDTLFFRDGKPFTMGHDVWASGIFPPYPSVIYGVLRSAYISYYGSLGKFYRGVMKEKIGTPDAKGTFGIRGVYLKKKQDMLFPLPLDLVVDKEKEATKESNITYKMKLEENTGSFIVQNSLPYSLIPGDIERAAVPDNSFISDLTLKEYLNDSDSSFKFEGINDLIISEPKTGIKRSQKTHSTEEGFLYRVGMNRLLDDVSIIVDYAGIDGFEHNCLFRIGGEGKAVCAKRIDDFKMPELSENSRNIIDSKRRFKLCLATPAIFKHGWLPDGTDEETLIWRRDGSALKLIAASVGKYLSIGGWDIKKNEPKPMQRAVPGGSVYYFEIIEGNATSVIEGLHYKNISNENSEQGFGLSFVGIA